MVTVLWVVFGLVVVGLVLWYGGIIGGGGNGGGDAVTQEESAGNGEGGETAEDADINGDTGAEGNGEEADGDATAEGNGAAEDEAAGGNGEESEVTAEDNGNGDAATDQAVSVFTAEQAERGQEAFSQHCAECHGGQLDGQPPLSGGGFASTWEGMPVNALYEVISQTMPLDSPGSLDEETYNDVTAHILAFNGMPEGDSELQAGDAESMETLISFDGSDEDGGDTQADEGGSNGEEQAADGDTDADSQAEEDGQAADSSDSEAAGIELQDTAEGQPGAGEGWIDLTVEPDSATVNVLGPGGYLGQLQGGAGTITGLEPGNYVFTASLGNFSHRVDAQVALNETVSVDLRIPELADSPDVAGGQGGNGEATSGDSEDTQAGQDGEQGGNGGEAESTEEGAGQEGNGEGASAEVNGGNDAAEENGNDSESSASNGDEAWYTDEQAETGAEDYSASCASCHGDDGMGDPPLADGALEGSFDTVWALFDYTSTEMPQDEPGALDEETYVNITAHLLALNDYPSGDEELTADEDAMSDMSLGNGAGNGNGDAQSGESEEAGGQDESQQADGAGSGGDQAAQEGTSAERGASMYASNCAMCHGQTLRGVDAPPLAGPVFMDRWGGHPVDWLYFQAHTSMPPDSPGSLDEQAYVDIIVHILAENGILEGDEEFVPDDLLLRSIIIGNAEQQDATLENRIDALRRTLHEPFADFEEFGEPDTGTTEPGGPRSPVSFRESADATDEAGGADGQDGNGNAEEDGIQDDTEAAEEGNGGNGDNGAGEEGDGNGNQEDDGTEDEAEAAEEEGGNNE